jgi:hypothetical protein
MEVITLKKLLATVFTFALALSFALPVFAQEAGGTTETPKKEKKMKKEKKEKKSKKEKKDSAAETK